MSKEFHEAYVEGEVKPPSERSTGFVFAAVCAIVGVIFRDNVVVLSVSAVLCLCFIAVSLMAPGILKPLNIVWFRFSMLLHKIVNPIVLGVMFLLAIVPFGLLMRIWRDPLRSKRPEGRTYWVDRDKETPETHSMTNQF